MLKQIIENNWIEARGIIGFYEANTVEDDDIEVYQPSGDKQVLCRLHTLR
jgi:5-methyltetrahydrofolate--homocysteine methyltransferase